LRAEGGGQAEMANYLEEHYSEKAAAPSTAPAEGEKKTGGCPFSAVVAQMGLGSTGEKAHGASEFEWTPDAKERLEKTPSFVQPMVKGGIEAYARKMGFK